MVCSRARYDTPKYHSGGEYQAQLVVGWKAGEYNKNIFVSANSTSTKGTESHTFS